MEEEAFCPYCDELVNFEFSDDYYECPQYSEADRSECPNCHKIASMSWEIQHRISFSKLK